LSAPHEDEDRVNDICWEMMCDRASFAIQESTKAIQGI